MPGKDASPLYPEQPALLRAAPVESCKQLSTGGGEKGIAPCPRIAFGAIHIKPLRGFPRPRIWNGFSRPDVIHALWPPHFRGGLGLGMTNITRKAALPLYGVDILYHSRCRRSNRWSCCRLNTWLPQKKTSCGSC
jgi:hypothetical protein